MAKVYLDREDLQHNELPPVCMKCGRPSTTVVHKRFVLPHSVNSHATVPAPMCRKHRHHWLSRIFITFGGLGFFAILIVVFGILAASDAFLKAWSGGILVVSVIGLFATLVLGAVLQVTAIQAKAITNREIILVRVHPDFVDAVDEVMDEYGEDDRRRRDRRRRYRDPDVEFCPSCGELIRIDATHCRFCGEAVEGPKRKHPD